jgi:hypothetical protein
VKSCRAWPIPVAVKHLFLGGPNFGFFPWPCQADADAARAGFLGNPAKDRCAVTLLIPISRQIVAQERPQRTGAHPGSIRAVEALTTTAATV